MDYLKIASLVPVSKWEMLSDKLIDVILASKNDDKLPSQLAKTILHHWQNDNLKSESGLATLLESAVLVELEKTFSALNELQMSDVAEQIKQKLAS